MGYNTDFTGEFYFTKELNLSTYKLIEGLLGCDLRERNDIHNPEELTHVDLEFSYEHGSDIPQGLVWDGSEKTYEMTEKLNLIITEARKLDPDFAVHGEMEAHCEDYDEFWKIVVGADGFLRNIEGEMQNIYKED